MIIIFRDVYYAAVYATTHDLIETLMQTVSIISLVEAKISHSHCVNRVDTKRERHHVGVCNVYEVWFAFNLCDIDERKLQTDICGGATQWEREWRRERERGAGGCKSERTKVNATESLGISPICYPFSHHRCSFHRSFHLARRSAWIRYLVHGAMPSIRILSLCIWRGRMAKVECGER